MKAAPVREQRTSFDEENFEGSRKESLVRVTGVVKEEGKARLKIEMELDSIEIDRKHREDVVESGRKGVEWDEGRVNNPLNKNMEIGKEGVAEYTLVVNRTKVQEDSFFLPDYTTSYTHRLVILDIEQLGDNRAAEKIFIEKII